MDGILGMEGNGPIQGKAKAAGVLVAGRDMPGVDATCCRIMGIDPGRIAYLRIAGMPEQIHQIGERVETVRTDFELLPAFRYIRLA